MKTEETTNPVVLSMSDTEDCLHVYLHPYRIFPAARYAWALRTAVRSLSGNILTHEALQNMESVMCDVRQPLGTYTEALVQHEKTITQQFRDFPFLPVEASNHFLVHSVILSFITEALSFVPI